MCNGDFIAKFAQDLIYALLLLKLQVEIKVHCSFDCRCPIDEENRKKLAEEMKLASSKEEVLVLIEKANKETEGNGCCLQILNCIPRELRM